MASTLADINSQIKKHDEQIAQLRKQAEDLRNQERAGVIEELRKKIAEYGLTASDLKLGARAGKRSATTAAPKSAASFCVTQLAMRFEQGIGPASAFPWRQMYS